MLARQNDKKRSELIDLLKRAYWMEIETVMSYVANSVNPDGVRAQEVIEALETEILEELGHARQYAERIKELWGIVPGSLEFEAEKGAIERPVDPARVRVWVRAARQAAREE